MKPYKVVSLKKHPMVRTYVYCKYCPWHHDWWGENAEKVDTDIIADHWRRHHIHKCRVNECFTFDKAIEHG